MLGGQPLDQTGLGGGQQLGHGAAVVAQRRPQAQAGGEVEAGDGGPGGAKLTASAFQQIPGLPALDGQGGVFDRRAAGTVAVTAASGAGKPVIVAPAAIGSPAAPVPAGAGVKAFFSASSRVNGSR